MADAIISRKQARAQGLTRYFTGLACKNGHIEEHSTASALCLACMREYAAVYRVANREKVNAASRCASAKRFAREPEKVRELARITTRKWRAANPEKVNIQSRKRYAANQAKRVEQARAYRVVNSEEARASTERWRKANLEKAAAKERNRRARKRAAEGFHTAQDIQRIYQAQNGKCAYCRQKVGKKYHVDHIQALSKGGSNWPANLQILCPTCNSQKQARDPLEHARTIGLLL